MKMVKKNWLLVVLIGVLILIVGAGLLVKFGMERAAAEEILTKFPDRGVPRMNITLNGVTLDEINAGSKDVKYEGNEVAVYEGSEKVGDYGNARVKGRGNGTWVQEKKPYQIKFDKKVDMFGMGKAKKWVLLANATDGTNVRNELAFNLEKFLDMAYPMSGSFVELYFDGDYAGLYYLTHNVEIGKHTVRLRNDFGVLMELDNLYWKNERHVVSNNGDRLVLKDSVRDELSEKAMQLFLEKYIQLEEAISKKDFTIIESIIDVDSFAKYFLLSEISVNPDAYWTSFYMYMDGGEDKIHAGPGWDFDMAFCNRRWYNWLGERFYSPKEIMVRKNEIMTVDEYKEKGLGDWASSGEAISSLLFDLMDIPGFSERVSEIFSEKLSGKKDELVSIISLRFKEIKYAEDVDENMWGEPNENELEDMLDWFNQRYDYLEEYFGGRAITRGG